MTDVMPQRAGMLDLTAKYRSDEGEFFFSGIQALVRLPFEQLRVDRAAGHRTAAFVSGYQGSPLGGYDRELLSVKALLDELHIVHTQGINEELAATSVMGSQTAITYPTARYEGVLGIWYGKAPGLDRAGDAIRHANYAGTASLGGVLALTGDDPACKSSTLPSGSEATMADLHLPVISPGNVREILDFGRHAIALSRAAGLWSGFKIVTAIADATGSADVDPGRIVPVIPEIEYLGRPYRARLEGNFVGASNDIEREIYEARLPLARAYAAANPALNQVTVDPGDAWLGIVASGRTYYEVIEALDALGFTLDQLRQRGVRLLRLGMVHPLDPGVVRRFARGLGEILVVEEKRPFLETAIRDILYGSADQPRVIGKRDPDGRPLVPHHGQLDADLLAAPLRARLAQRLELPPVVAPPAMKSLIPVSASRTPFFCSGCPHNTSTQVPDGALVGAGIGCHGMATLMDPERVGRIMGMTQMGGEGSQWIGIEPFVDTPHLIQNLGDGTYFHSGSLAVRAAVAAGSNITYKILYNGAVAMTGGQDPAGAIPVPELAATLVLSGVKRVIVTTDDVEKYQGVRLHDGAEVWHRDRIIEAQETLATVKGVTVIVHDQQCAAEKRRDRKRGKAVDPAMRIVINERVCEGCGDCGAASNCLSVQPVETEFGRKTRIDQSSCNKDYSCIKGDCPSFLTVVPRKTAAKASGDPAKARREGGGRRRPMLDATELREPTPLFAGDEVTVRMPGIGGTGVVTVNQILGTAAMLDGRHVAGLDQTGLSQKAGPVVSDLRISRTPVQGASKVTAGEVDTYLVFDLLVGLAPANLAGATAGRTLAVVSTSRTPTGRMITDPYAVFPAVEPLLAELDAATRGDDNVHLDAAAVCAGLFGDTTTANVLLLGAAYQRGGLPIAAAAIEQAIELNGAAVEANKLAFRWGRMWVQDRARVEAAMQAPDWGVPAPSKADRKLIGDLDGGELGRLLRLRVPDLVAFQDRACAARYVDVVRLAATAEARVLPGETAFAEAVARGLHKLMAYKDEYEVARLHRLAVERARVAAEVGEDVVVSYNLHPPVLRALGMKRKIKLGPWFSPAMAALAAGKRLRGTAADPFGRAGVRRVERALIDEYRGAVEAVAAALTPANHADAVALAALPDLVRGYEDIKLANVDRYHRELAAVRSRLGV